MEVIIKVTALCLIGAVLAILLKKSNPELALLLALAACVTVLLLMMKGLEDVHTFLEEMAAWGGLPTNLFSPLWKTVGIAMLTRIGTELCKDADENAMASLVEMSGAFGAVLVAIPLFEAVWDMLQSLI